MDITILRFFTVYGPRQRPDMAIHKFTKKIIDGEEIEVFGDGLTKRDYTYITDIIHGICKTLVVKERCEIYNLGEERTVELSYLIELIERNLGKKAKRKVMSEQPGDVKITHADISRAKATFGYAPRVNIEDGIKEFVKWYKSNRL
jgi:UDP-glucuronate 4-epimerase